jgi:hypothetical protein
MATENLAETLGNPPSAFDADQFLKYKRNVKLPPLRRVEQKQTTLREIFFGGACVDVLYAPEASSFFAAKLGCEVVFQKCS